MTCANEFVWWDLNVKKIAPISPVELLNQNFAGWAQRATELWIEYQSGLDTNFKLRLWTQSDELWLI